MTDTAIHLSIEQLEEDLFLATSKDVPGLVAEGRTIREVVEIAQDAARKIAESCIEHGDPLPAALSAIAYDFEHEELLVPVSLP
jgi:predicted RNase H-like HicB family nuclease